MRSAAFDLSGLASPSRWIPRWVIALVLVSWLLAGAVAVSWHQTSAASSPTDPQVFDTAGDEVHYLVLTRSLFVYHTVDEVQAYSDSFAPGGLMEGADFSSTHTIPGDKGSAHPVHGLGLSFVLAAGWALGGTFGAKLVMILTSGLVVAAVGIASSRSFQSQPLALLVTCSVCLGAPVIIAASQIYPDLISGAIPLCVFTAVFVSRNPRRVWVDAGLAGMISVLPWLQVKNLPAALICLAVLCLSLRQNGMKRRAVVLGAASTIMLLSVLIYNFMLFGLLTGPYGPASSEIGLTSAMVFFGLHLDRAHGMFFLNPLLLVGAAEVVVRLVGREKWSIAYLMTYLFLVVPNATHVNWYGGFSFAGRFGWSASVLLMLATVQGLKRIHGVRPSAALACIGAGIAVQILLATQYALGHEGFYNQAAGTPIEEYLSRWGPFGRDLPAFYDRSWAFTYVPNLVAVGLLTCFLVAVAVVTLVRSAESRRQLAYAELADTFERSNHR